MIRHWIKNNALPGEQVHWCVNLGHPASLCLKEPKHRQIEYVEIMLSRVAYCINWYCIIIILLCLYVECHCFVFFANIIISVLFYPGS